MVSTRHRRAVAASALALTALTVAGCGRRTEPAPAEHLLLVTLDTTRADRLGSYGRPGAGTPRLDALAASGVRVERAYAQTPITLPSHVSILTGLLPPRTGVHVNGQTKMHAGVRTLAQVLAERGFYTAAAVGGFPVSARYPVSRGFQRFDDRMVNPDSPEGTERDAGEVVDAALGLLAGRGDRRVFLWVHFFDPHDPYDPPPPFAERFPSDPYQGEIARVDAALGRLLDGLAALLPEERTLVCVVGDHGEALGQHGEPTHGFFVYDATLRIPLILAGPGVPRGVTIPGPVQTVDLLPTLLARLGLPQVGGLDGRILDFESDGPDTTPIYVESDLPYVSYGWSPLRGVVDGWTKLIDAPRPELYDLRSDPDEEDNRIAASPAEHRRLKETLEALTGAAGPAEPSAVDADPRLLSLGYVGTGSRSRTGAGLPDPKDRLPTYLLFQSAGAALERREPQDVLAITDELLRQEESPGARFKRAAALRMLHRLDEAAEELDRVEALDPGHAGLALERTYLALATRDAAAALRHAEAQLAESPDHPEAHMLRGAARELLGDTGGAEEDYRAALDLNPAYGAASLRLAALLVRAGRIEEAREQLRDHLRYQPGDQLASGLLGELETAK